MGNGGQCQGRNIAEGCAYRVLTASSQIDDVSAKHEQYTDTVYAKLTVAFEQLPVNRVRDIFFLFTITHVLHQIINSFQTIILIIFMYNTVEVSLRVLLGRRLELFEIIDI